MNKLLSIFLMLLALPILAQEPVDSRQREIVFRSVNVLPMDQDRVLENQVVVVKDGKITAMGAPGKVKFGANAVVVEAKGKYLMPGLAEMHAHVPTSDDLEQMKEVMRLYALNGITTIRSMQGHPRHLELRSLVQKGDIIAPRFYACGPPLSGQSAKDPETAISMVKSQKQQGFDHVKILPGLSLETFNAAARTAREAGIPFAGHVPSEVGIWRALESGYNTIDHLDGFIEGMVPGIEKMASEQVGLFGMFVADKADLNQMPKLMKGLKQNNVWVVPTQALADRWFTPALTAEQLRNEPEMKYMDPATLENWVKSKNSIASNPNYDREKMTRYNELRRRLILECQKNGVGLLLGSDAPQVFNVPGFSTHHELQYLVDAGLTPFQALQTGTTYIARFYNQTATSGTIKTGAVADLILVSGNPLQDISQTKNIEGVMVGHRWLPKAAIEQQLKGLEKR